MEQVVERAKKILLNPSNLWEETRSESINEISLIKEYLIYIAAVPAIAGFFGSLFTGCNFFIAIFWAILFWICAIGGIWIAAKALEFVTNNFNVESDFTLLFKLMTITFTPILLSGIFFLIPPLYGLSIIGLYGFYLFWIGFPKILYIPEGERFNISIIGVIILIITILLMFTLPAIISGTSVYYLSI